MVAELTLAAEGTKQAGGTVGINDWMEINNKPFIEVFRVTSDANGDYFFCRKIQKVTGVLIQNHGAAYATGAATDEPKYSVTHGTNGGTAKITITHTATEEVFSVFVFGEVI